MTRVKFYSLLFAIFIAGLLFAWLEHDQYISALDLQIPGCLLLGKFGEALIVAVILAVSVDTFLKREFAEGIIKKVSPYFVGYGLPEEMIHELESIRGIQAYLEDARFDFELDKGTKNDRLLLKVTVSSSVRNRSPDEARFVHVIACQRPRSGEQNKLIAAGATGVTLKDSPASGGYSFSEAKIEEQIKSVRLNPGNFPSDIADVVKSNEL